MRKVIKSEEPQELSSWKRRNPHGRYSALPAEIRHIVRLESTKDQHFICPYCGATIDGSNITCHNEHVEAQDVAPNRTVDYYNIIASCNRKNSCGNSHGSLPLPLTPFMDECENEFKYSLNGTVQGKTQRACNAIQALNLGLERKHNMALVDTRKQMLEALLYGHGSGPGEIDLLEDELLEMIIEELTTPQNGKLEAYSPALVCILQDFLAA